MSKSDGSSRKHVVIAAAGAFAMVVGLSLTVINSLTPLLGGGRRISPMPALPPLPLPFGDDRDTEVDRAVAPILGPVETDQFPGRLVQAGLQAGDLAHLAIQLRLLDAVAQVGDDLDQPRPRRRIQPKACEDHYWVSVVSRHAVGRDIACWGWPPQGM
ncbi:hypothetical protein [Kutzneria sp. CA-103260]|uniref:hypothetical protein n=1 Tax=Kutzneria sp. CA-103260 TaxID=2802641 RepID=UPI001BADCEE3|nr:hypothetical protein [Kutzneria sp. CA-103260]